jgi:4'-phosphopantetheinyl transferase
LHRLLDAAERDRAERFHFERDRTRFIVAHGLLRRLLSRALERSTIAFTYGVNGKPALAQDDDFQFNLSHSADWAVFALVRQRQVGIDLESAQSLERGELPAMAGRIFSKTELDAWLGLLDEKSRAAAFLRAWTRKEACLKAAGLRLDEMTSIATGFAPIRAPEIVTLAVSDGSARRFSVHDLIVPAPFACALAVED